MTHWKQWGFTHSYNSSHTNIYRQELFLHMQFNSCGQGVQLKFNRECFHSWPVKMNIKCHHFKLSQLIAVNSIHRSLGNSRFCVEGEWYSFPSKHGASPNVVSMSAYPMLAQRLRRWLNVETELGECLVFAGNWHEWKLWLPRQSPEGEVMSVGVVTARGRRHGLWPGAGWSRSAKLDSLSRATRYAEPMLV